MTTKVLVNTARERFYHSESRIYLTEKYKNKLNIPMAGGLWQITPELIAFLRTSTKQKEILVDSYGNPVEVDVGELLSLASETYSAVMGEWLDEHRKLSKFR